MVRCQAWDGKVSHETNKQWQKCLHSVSWSSTSLTRVTQVNQRCVKDVCQHVCVMYFQNKVTAVRDDLLRLPWIYYLYYVTFIRLRSKQCHWCSFIAHNFIVWQIFQSSLGDTRDPPRATFDIQVIGCAVHSSKVYAVCQKSHTLVLGEKKLPAHNAMP